MIVLSVTSVLRNFKKEKGRTQREARANIAKKEDSWSIFPQSLGNRGARLAPERLSTLPSRRI